MANILCYIDPASTALIWQILAGIFISLGVIFGVFWRRITTFFKSIWVKLFHKKNSRNESNEVDESVLELEDNVSDEIENNKKDTCEKNPSDDNASDNKN